MGSELSALSRDASSPFAQRVCARSQLQALAREARGHVGRQTRRRRMTAPPLADARRISSPGRKRGPDETARDVGGASAEAGAAGASSAFAPGVPDAPELADAPDACA